MRAVSADADAILRGSPRVRVRLSVKDSGGTFRDLTTYALGENLLLSVAWREDVDSPGVSWEAGLVREMELLSVAPLMQSSGLNRNFDISVSYAALVQVGRQMKVEYALQAEDDGSAPVYALAFTGYIDTVSWGSGDELEITGRGDEAKLIDTYVERERIYAFAQGANADRGCFVYTVSTVYAVGDRVIPTDSKRNGHYYRVTTGGTSAASEPTWPTGGGSTVVSGGVTFTESGTTSTSIGTNVETIIQQIMDDNIGTAFFTLSTPVSPAWAVKWFMVGRQPLFDELRLLADQIGWGLRFRFDSGSGTMKLTLYDPNRANVTSARTFAKFEAEVKRAQVEIFDIRNAVNVIFSDSQDLDAGGFPKRKTISVTSSTSITKYGRRFAEIAEGSSSNIDTTSEATTLANAVLEDLREPEADFEAEVPLFPMVEATDLYTLAANGVHFDTDQKLAVVGYEHVYSADESVTNFRMRGRPSTGATTWLQRCTDAYNGAALQLTVVESVLGFVIAADTRPVGGARIDFTWGGRKGGD